MTSALQRQAGPDGPATASSWSADGALLWLLTAAWTAAGIVLWVLFPMTASVLLGLCCVAPLAWYWTAERQLPWYPPSPVAAALALAGLYLLVNASWSLSLWSAFKAIAMMVVIVAVLHVVPNTLARLDAAPLRAMAAGTLIGLLVGGALLCLEIFSEQSLRRILMRLIPALQPTPLHLDMNGGLKAYLPNANVGVLTILFWPAALIAAALGLVRGYRWGVLAAVAAVAVTVLASEHETSKVALAGAAVAFGLYLVRPRLTMGLIAAGWVTATLLVVPIAWLAYRAEAHRADWLLPYSARHRVVIWGYTSGEVAKAPLLGIGIGTARALHEDRDLAAPPVPGTTFQPGPGLHSHNAYLQVWYETGAVGALILLGLGLLVLRAITGFADAAQPYLAATFVTGALLAASSYSVWAPWLMATLAMACVFAALGAALPPRAAGAER